ncbi:hypothetical protein Poli38472_003750 [Pythium oligandrum]|uniref:Uncharacterized protein n=1 Tax=Pythium oligandrum TaxID=41045 RepID=A0A8K1FJE5_PYTOL|nr:hypothetical protein Poli38472_003750 [Pythium oligandrum]|eukprot:TMW65985.1 hypothetical protein Poli38472_003750 [Pythium oligandrum]
MASKPKHQNPHDTPDAAKKRKEEREYGQFLKAQQKLVGKKTTEEYARLRLRRRQEKPTKTPSVHQNGKQKTTKTVSCDVPLSARAPETENKAPNPTTRRVRPQSAKPVLQTTPSPATRPSTASVITGKSVCVSQLERRFYNPVPLTTHLATSQSAPRIVAAMLNPTETRSKPIVSARKPTERPASPPKPHPESRFTEDSVTESGRRHIVVYMQRLGVYEDDESDDDVDVDVGETTMTRPPQQQQPPREELHRSVNPPPRVAVRHAW